MTQEPESQTGISAIPIVIVGAFLVVFTIIFIIEMANLSQASGGLEDEEVTADSYLDIVQPLLVGADASLAPDLLEKYTCNSCHNHGLAPAYTEIRQNAASRRAPMSAEAYIYESIIYPGAYRVEGQMNNMPRNFGDRIPDDDLGHIIAYLAGVDSVSPMIETTPDPQPEVTQEPLTAETYAAEVEFLLSNADATRGEALLEQYGCNACHAGEAAGVVAPAHHDVAQVAAERRPPLSAAAYIYESIIHPNYFIVPGYAASMPTNYQDLISITDLGDIIAYLLGQE
ncbi:MAG: hypothetical protein D6711_11160 [Chloroflexi bacterium]|nr:MAG: hypothetical protein D6711_11160 [Chloroflexota bacterium]